MKDEVFLREGWGEERDGFNPQPLSPIISSPPPYPKHHFHPPPHPYFAPIKLPSLGAGCLGRVGGECEFFTG